MVVRLIGFEGLVVIGKVGIWVQMKMVVVQKSHIVKAHLQMNGIVVGR